MTTPLFQDHPDWVRTTAASAVEVVNSQQAQGVGTFDHGTFFVGNLPYLWLSSFVQPAGGVRIRLSWRTTKTGTTFATNFVDTIVNVPADGPIRVVGPWVNIATLVDVVGRTVNLRVYQVAQEAQVQTDVAHSGLIAVDGAAIGAVAAVTVDANRVRWGWGHWQIDVNGTTNLNGQLRAVDYLGATRIVDFMPVGQFGGTRLILMPPMPLRLTVANFDAAPHTYYAVLYSHPGPM